MCKQDSRLGNKQGEGLTTLYAIGMGLNPNKRDFGTLDSQLISTLSMAKDNKLKLTWLYRSCVMKDEETTKGVRDFIHPTARSNALLPPSYSAPLDSSTSYASYKQRLRREDTSLMAAAFRKAYFHSSNKQKHSQTTTYMLRHTPSRLSARHGSIYFPITVIPYVKCKVVELWCGV